MKAKVQRKMGKGKNVRSAVAIFCLLPFAFFLIPACQQKMAQQPSFRALEETPFFEDGRASRPLEAGTVARGQLSGDHPLMTGLTAEGRKVKKSKEEGTTSEVLAGSPDDIKNYVDAFPFKMGEDDLVRGMQRFTIFCTPCHGTLGDGKGKIVERGYLKPTSYHADYEFAKHRKADDKSLPPGYSRGFGRYRLELPMDQVPVGYYFEVITKGFGGMPDHAAQIPPADRWRIIAYIRALQLSQAASLKELPKDLQETAKKAADEAGKDKVGGHHP